MADKYLIPGEVRSRILAVQSKAWRQFTSDPAYLPTLRAELGLNTFAVEKAEKMLEEYGDILPKYQPHELHLSVFCATTSKWRNFTLTPAERTVYKNTAIHLQPRFTNVPIVLDSWQVNNNVLDVVKNTSIITAAKIIPNLLTLSPTAAEMHGKVKVKRNRKVGKKWDPAIAYFKRPDVKMLLGMAALDDGEIVDY